jgi:hypothetical protein
MIEDKQNVLYYFLAVTLIISGVAGGGYFCCVSAVLSVILMLFIVCKLVKSSVFSIACDINLAALSCLTAGYFLVSLWAVDPWMALMGGVKFLPIFLFFFLLCQEPWQRERLIQLLPFLGSLMTLFTFIMMQFPVFQMYVSVAGRLAGFFQYPNTYALFMLVCLLVAVYRIDLNKLEWLDICNIFAALAGIYLSGSRTVMILAAAVVLLIFISKRELRKYGIPGVGIFVILVAILAFCGYGAEIFSRFVSLAENSSTFWGRFLYAWDAVKMIAAHPFGMGYYGYYFVQQEMQTGVYSVVNVHNEFLQIMLDIGILPALLMYGAVLRSVISKNNSGRNRLILLVILLHSLFDYDFQFLTMDFLVLLFLDFRNVQKIRISKLTKAVATVVLFVSIWAFESMGVSDFFYIEGNHQKAFRRCRGNTMAKVELLKEAESAEEMEEFADSILESNSHVAVAYSAKARAAFSRGDVETFIRFKLRAIQLAPYQYEEYVDYLDSLAYCEKLYRQAGDMDSARFCVEKAEEIPKMLKQVGDRTSSLGWKIKDRPEVALSQTDLERIVEMRSKIEKD